MIVSELERQRRDLGDRDVDDLGAVDADQMVVLVERGFVSVFG
jgi:hypothetical protein